MTQNELTNIERTLKQAEEELARLGRSPRASSIDRSYYNETRTRLWVILENIQLLKVRPAPSHAPSHAPSLNQEPEPGA